MTKKTSTSKSLLDKAKDHKVKRQAKKPTSTEELEVYVAYMNGEIDTSQACFALNITASTFRGNSGSAIRDAILSGKIEKLEIDED